MQLFLQLFDMFLVWPIELRRLIRVHQLKEQIRLEFIQLKPKGLIQHELWSIQIFPQRPHQLNQFFIHRDPLQQRTLLNFEHTIRQNHRPIKLIIVFFLVKHQPLYKQSKLVPHVHILSITAIIAPEMLLHWVDDQIVPEVHFVRNAEALLFL